MDNKLDECVKKLKHIIDAHMECPMCGNKDFMVYEGFTKNTIQPNLDQFLIGGPSIPCVSIVCTRCGFLSQHAVEVINPSAFDDAKGEKTE